jgi:hypothetical protein
VCRLLAVRQVFEIVFKEFVDLNEQFPAELWIRIRMDPLYFKLLDPDPDPGGHK